MKKKIGTMDIILVLVGLFLLLFTLVTCVFAAIASECGIMGWIKNTKERAKERQWMKEDQKMEEKNNGNYR